MKMARHLSRYLKVLSWVLAGLVLLAPWWALSLTHSHYWFLLWILEPFLFGIYLAGEEMADIVDTIEGKK